MRPSWLNKKINIRSCSGLKETLRGLNVETVCEQAMCPNMGECFSHSQATFLILGKSCTRMCSFCNIEKGTPKTPDAEEPERVADAVERLSLKHVVITSVTRDDLYDGGASLFVDTVSAIRRKPDHVTIELLIPDFKLSLDALKAVANSSADIVAHNLETVPSLYPAVRKGSDYNRSLDVLRALKNISPSLKTKSGMMLGMGETSEEILQVMKDARSAGCDFFSIGQYLAPSKRHYPVKEYINPDRFGYYKEEGLKMGFEHVESAPYVRSSYMAEQYLGENFRVAEVQP